MKMKFESISNLPIDISEEIERVNQGSVFKEIKDLYKCILHKVSEHQTVVYINSLNQKELIELIGSEYKIMEFADCVVCGVNTVIKNRYGANSIDLPKFRPYKTKEEFRKAMKEHGPFLKYNDFALLFPYAISDDRIDTNSGTYMFKDLAINENYKWEDGTLMRIIYQNN